MKTQQAICWQSIYIHILIPKIMDISMEKYGAQWYTESEPQNQLTAMFFIAVNHNYDNEQRIVNNKAYQNTIFFSWTCTLPILAAQLLVVWK